MPALETRMSTLPRSLTVFATPASTCSSFVTSISTAVAFTPRARISAAAASAAAWLMSAMAMWQPLSAYTSAMRLPMPLAAPVTSATLFFTLMVFSWGWCSVFPRCVFHIHPQVAQLAVQMRAFHAGRLGQFADAAAGLLQLMQQIGALELFARLAQRQVEIDARRIRRIRRSDRAERGFDFGRFHVRHAAQHEQALHEIAQLAHVARPGVGAQALLRRQCEAAAVQSIAAGEEIHVQVQQ